MQYTLPAFPEQISEHIPAPNIATLLTMPIYARATRETFLQTCHPFQKLLYDNSPITGKYQFICIDSYVQVIQPDSCPINIRYRGGWLHEWHNDGIWRMADEEFSTFHIYMSKCDARTAFNVHPYTCEIPDDMDHMDFSELVNYKWEEWGLEARKADPEHILTFTTHMHTSTPPKRREFRYFFRISESNTIEPRGREESILDHSIVTTLVDGNNSRKHKSIIQHLDGVYLPFIR